MELTLKHMIRTLFQSGGASFRVAELDLKQTELVLEQAELIIIEQVELKTEELKGSSCALCLNLRTDDNVVIVVFNCTLFYFPFFQFVCSLWAVLF